jgi:hypothetical protein
MSVKQFIVFAFVLPIMISCSKSGIIEQKIGDRINACKPTEVCIIKIKELTDFQWDKMYVFTSGARNEHIDKALGMKYPNSVEFTRLMVFTKDGKIVHREEEPTSVENIVNGEISFKGSYVDRYYLYTPDTASFRAKKTEFKEGSYYKLTQLNR